MPVTQFNRTTFEHIKSENLRLQDKVDEFRSALASSEKQLEQQSAFFANISHEIRTPLNAIVGMADLLADTPLDAKQSECVDVIRKGSSLLLSIINDVLNFSRIESGNVKFESIPINPRILAENSITLLAHRAWEKGVEPIVNIAPELPFMVMGDPTHTAQILANFISNAIKFTEKGHVSLDVTLETLQDDGQAVLRFTVTDTGIGISPEALGLLFRPFQQAEAHTMRLYGGTGLGLAISKKLVDLMGGRLGVESHPGVGSSFWAEIPFPVVNWTIDPAKPTSFPLNSKRVLLIDSQPQSQQAAHNLFSTLGGLTLQCTGCSQALEFITAGEKFDIVVLASNCIFDDSGNQNTYFINMCMTASVPLLLAVPQGHMDEYQDLLFTDDIGLVTKPLRIQPVSREALRVLGQPVPTHAAPTHHTAQPENLPAAKSDNTTPRVLVAEDNSVNRKVISRIFEKFGIAPDIAVNGLEAVHAMKEKAYDVVFMDCQMPEMDGWEATQNRRIFEAQNQIERTVIVALTADAMPHDRQKCLDKGMDDYMAKPVRPKDIAAMLDKYCNYNPLAKE